MKKNLYVLTISCFTCLLFTQIDAKKLTSSSIPTFDKILVYYPQGFNEMLVTAKYANELSKAIDQLKSLEKENPELIPLILDAETQKISKIDERTKKILENIKKTYALAKSTPNTPKKDVTLVTPPEELVHNVNSILRDDFINRTKDFFGFLYNPSFKSYLKPILAEIFAIPAEMKPEASSVLLYQTANLEADQVAPHFTTVLEAPENLQKISKEILQIASDLYESMPTAVAEWKKQIAKKK